MYWLAILIVPALAVAGRPGVSTSRRVLACALVLVVPLAGLVLAALVRRTRGGAIELEPDDEVPQRRLSSAEALRLAEEPPIVDRLLAGDPGERLAALVALSSAGNADAVAVLRWTVEHGSPDVVLEAALTLEELELRCESQLSTATAALTAAPAPDASLALDVAHAAEAMVLNRLADGAAVPRLVATARYAYARALAWAPEHAAQIKRGLLQLQLAAGSCMEPALALAGDKIDIPQPVVRKTNANAPRRISEAFNVREVAAAALMS